MYIGLKYLMFGRSNPLYILFLNFNSKNIYLFLANFFKNMTQVLWTEIEEEEEAIGRKNRQHFVLVFGGNH